MVWYGQCMVRPELNVVSTQHVCAKIPKAINDLNVDVTLWRSLLFQKKKLVPMHGLNS